MTITIAGKTFSTRKPKDLDAILVAATGCNASENRKIIDGSPLPGRIAAALHPFLADVPSVPELATLIVAELARPDNTLIADARKLFDATDVAVLTDKKAD